MSIADLDQLHNLCRTPEAKRLIREGIDSYRVGAYRASIIVTWIAVVYDIIEKLREIALTGDAQAKSKVDEFEQIQKTGDLVKALEFERTILAEAKDTFELISPQEMIDMERLQADRNRSAHPNLIRESEAYSPSAEQSRLHIRNAIEIALSRPPVQSKAALTLIQAEIDSAYFPIVDDDAYSILQNSPIARGKENLIRTFVRGAVSSCIKEGLSDTKLRQRTAAIRAVQRLHPSVVSNEFETRLPGQFSKTSDAEFPRLVKLLELLPELQERVNDAVSVKLKHFVENLSEADASSLFPTIVAVDLINESIPAVLKKITEGPDAIARLKEICEVFRATSRNVPDEILEWIVSNYVSSHSYDSANTLGEDLIIPNAKVFSKDFTRRIISAVENSQVDGSHQYTSVLSAMKQAGTLTPDEFDKTLSGTSRVHGYKTHLHNPPAPVSQIEPSTAP